MTVKCCGEQRRFTVIYMYVHPCARVEEDVDNIYLTTLRGCYQRTDVMIIGTTSDECGNDTRISVSHSVIERAGKCAAPIRVSAGGQQEMNDGQMPGSFALVRKDCACKRINSIEVCTREIIYVGHVGGHIDVGSGVYGTTTHVFIPHTAPDHELVLSAKIEDALPLSGVHRKPVARLATGDASDPTPLQNLTPPRTTGLTRFRFLFLPGDLTSRSPRASSRSASCGWPSAPSGTRRRSRRRPCSGSRF